VGYECQCHSLGVNLFHLPGGVLLLLTMLIKVVFTKRRIFAIFLGMVGYVLSTLLVGLARISYDYYLISTVSPSDYQSVLALPYAGAVRGFLKFLYSVLVVGAGLMVGVVAREKGWLYAALSGIVLSLLEGGFLLVAYLNPYLVYGPDWSVGVARELIAKQLPAGLVFSVYFVVLLAVGGFVGEWLYKRRSKR